MLHSGIDLHTNDWVIGTLDSAGTRVEERRLRTHRAAVATYFRSLPGPHRAVVESTASWYWLADLLREEGVELTLAHSKLVKAIAYAKGKTDAVDAHTLAQLLRVDLIPPAHMISPELLQNADVQHLLWIPGIGRINAFYQKQCRRKPKPVARGIVAQELGKIVSFVLTQGEA